MNDLQARIGDRAAPFNILKQDVLVRKLGDYFCGVYAGRVLDGIIHNLNNPLQILFVRSEQLEVDIEKLRGFLDSGSLSEAREVGERMAPRISACLKSLETLTEGLNTLTKGILTERRSAIGLVKIGDAVKDALFLLNADMFFKHRVQKIVSVEEPLPALQGRHSDFCIILLCLVQNALEAMAEADPKNLSIDVFAQGGEIILKVEDTGCGIPAECRKEVFDAFFTTKGDVEAEARCTGHAGIGLNIVTLILSDYCGRIDCDSGDGKTTFTVRLPVQV